MQIRTDICFLILVQGVYNLETVFRTEQKKGKTYIIPDKTTMVYELERAYFELNNLFGGDERLGTTSCFQ